MGLWWSSAEENRADEMYRHCQKIEALCDKLRQSNEGLNSEFHRNHQTLTGQIKKLNNIIDELEQTTAGSLAGSANRIADALGLGLTKAMIQHLRTIYNTIKELQQMRRDSVHNKEILRRVRSAKMNRIATPLELHEQLKCTIDTLLQDLDNYQITVQNKSETLIPQMRGTAAQFQKTLNEIKSAKEYINTLV